jgi:lysophospholipase L1-like esterase
MRDANKQIQKIVEARPGDVYVNIEPKLLMADGEPNPELFRKDGLHLSEKGYAILDDAVRPYLQK